MTRDETCRKCSKPRRWLRNTKGRHLEGGRGLCKACYQRAYRNDRESLGPPRVPMPELCRDCAEPTGRDAAKQRCGKCYHRWRRAGSPEDKKPRMRLTSADYSYSPAYGTARMDLAS